MYFLTKKFYALVAVGLCLILAACGADISSDVRLVHVDPEPYEQLTCEELHGEAMQREPKITELVKQLGPDFIKDTIGFAADFALPVPVFELLSPDETELADKLAQLQGEYKTIYNIMKDKECEQYVKPLQFIFEDAVGSS